jgi:type VI protein secretion system component Hcp
MTSTSTTSDQAQDRGRPGRTRLFRMLAGTAAVAVAAGAGTLLAGGESAGAATAGGSGAGVSAPYMLTAHGATGAVLGGDGGAYFAVSGYSWNTTPVMSGGVPTGKFTIGDFVFTHLVGGGTISLMNAYLANAPLRDVTLTYGPWNTGNKGAPAGEFSYRLTNCTILQLTHTSAGLNVSSNASGAEQVKLHCTGVSMTATPLNPDGTRGTVTFP